MRSFFVIFLVLFLIAGCSQSGVVKFIVNGKESIVNVELARTSAEFGRGLMFREKLDENAGMLFVFSDELPRSFWMKNTLIPLDLIFISAEKTVVGIKENFLPCLTDKCDVYNSKPAMFVLEVNSGFARANNIVVGTQAII